ncbi:MAG: CHAT domain-containing protein [Patulibacter sp.]|nr:CHAT domain-containing protein [Patulibacter sp.]
MDQDEALKNLAQLLLAAPPVDEPHQITTERRGEAEIPPIAKLLRLAGKDAERGLLIADLARAAGRPGLAALAAIEVARLLPAKEAVRPLENALRDAEDEVERSGQSAAPLMATATTMLAMAETETAGLDAARRRLADLHAYASQRGWRDLEVIVALELADACVASQNFAVAEQYLDIASNHDEDQIPESARRRLGAVLFLCAHDAYYARGDMHATVDLARRIRQYDSENNEAPLLGANAAIRLQDYATALAFAEHGLVLQGDRTALLLARATALDGMGRHIEADAAFDALPGKRAVYHEARGRSLARRGRHAEAAQAFRRALAACLAEGDPLHRIPSPARGLIDVRQQQGRLDLAFRDLAMLRRAESPVIRHCGHWMSAEVHRRRGRQKDTLRQLNLALSDDVGCGAVRLERVGVLIALDRVEAALDDLTVLAESNTSPEATIEPLTHILDADPDQHRARTLRGRAHLACSRPKAAEEDLSIAIERGAALPDAWHYRGIAQISVSPMDDHAEWNAGLTPERMFMALTDLEYATRVSGGASESLEAFKWLFERMCGLPQMVAALIESGGTALACNLFPGLTNAYSDYFAAMKASSGRQWRDGLELLLSAQAHFLRAGLVLEGMRLDVAIADTLLRLRRPHQALARLSKTDQLLALAARPLSASLHAKADSAIEKGARRGASILVFEVEHLPVSMLGVSLLLARIRLARADALAALRASDRALEALGDVNELVATILTHRKYFKGAQAIRSVMDILRDVGEPDRALTLAAEAEKLASSLEDIASIRNAIGTNRLTAGDPEAALAAFNEVAAMNAGAESAAEINAASTEYSLGRHNDAHTRLQRLEPSIGTLADLDQAQYWLLRARVLAALEGRSEARAMVCRARDIADGWRAEVHDPSLRATAQARTESIDELGLRLAVDAGDAADAHAWTQRVKSRVLQEELSFTGQPDVEALEREAVLERERDLLVSARDRLITTGPGYVDWDLLSMLDEGESLLDENATPPRVSPAAVSQRLADVQGRLTKVREALPTSEEPLPLPELPAFAWDAPALLVDYVLAPDRAVIFGLRPGDGSPSMVTVPIDAKRLVDLAARVSSNDPEPWLRRRGPWDDDTVRALVAPVYDWAFPGEHIVLVPHGPLHHLPLHAVQVDDQHGALADHHTVSYGPSAAVIRRCVSGRPPARLGHALVIGDSIGDLGHARIEAEVVAEILDGTPLVGEQAAKPRVLAAIEQEPPPNVLHVACHGRYESGAPDASGIILAGGGDRRGSPHVDAAVDLTAAEVVRLDATPSLVTLSACSSALSDRGAGDEPFGLIRSWLVAGTSSVVATLWPVDDLASLLLMTEFYRLLARDGLGTAAALRAAQQHLRELTTEETIAWIDDRRERLLPGPSPERTALDVQRRLHVGQPYSRRPFAHPYFWAAFTVTGDWH